MANAGKKLVPIYLVDAFTREPFKGNPAAVCILEEKLEYSVLQSIAAEMNLSETAFLQPLEKKPLKKTKTFFLRWFTPTVEVPLCGHATLATAAVLFYDFKVSADELIFQTKSGNLTAKKEKSGICLNFPMEEPVEIDPPLELISAVGVTSFRNVAYARRNKELLIHLFNGEHVRNLRPNFELMKSAKTKEETKGVVVTASGKPPYDFVSRFFAPWLGINEDPVTGAAHTVLAPYWSKMLKKKEMLAYQASKRGGELKVRIKAKSRVDLIGNAVIVLKGEMQLQTKKFHV
jgi:PhzF family phenazine biosynthesis protein